MTVRRIVAPSCRSAGYNRHSGTAGAPYHPTSKQSIMLKIAHQSTAAVHTHLLHTPAIGGVFWHIAGGSRNEGDWVAFLVKLKDGLLSKIKVRAVKVQIRLKGKGCNKGSISGVTEEVQGNSLCAFVRVDNKRVSLPRRTI